ncbi:MAG TPA: aminotransferase class I/II-fold pyridoxal phosphate-dependent enzyme [Acidimicrobiales bacterium]|nr:aminotransferase class I/II-fold pyridoxal phosphate-dependent enzyme [Acidimicrobiales bacterium]
MTRVYLSPPDVGDEERRLLLEAFDSNWIAPLGPHVDAFEKEVAERIGVPGALALSSGTAALHLALILLGVEPGDDVFVPTQTFIATANVVTYVGARPVLVDSDPGTWTIDPVLVADELEVRARQGRLPAAVVTVDLYGQCADYDRLLSTCAEFEVPLLEDAAEALGANYGGRPAGSLGAAGVFSFNGNKIITTSGGGMLVSSDESLIDRARYLSTQAREPVVHYEHLAVGFNYRLSNLLAAVGRGQLLGLDDRVARRRAINARYRAALSELPGLEFMPVASYGEPNYWLTCVLVDPDRFGATGEDIRIALEALDIESRPTWKPLHLQPVYAGAPTVGGAVAASIFEKGLCLPSGSRMGVADLDRVTETICALAG